MRTMCIMKYSTTTNNNSHRRQVLQRLSRRVFLTCFRKCLPILLFSLAIQQPPQILYSSKHTSQGRITDISILLRSLWHHAYSDRRYSSFPTSTTHCFRCIWSYFSRG